MDEDNASVKKLIQGMVGGEVQLIQGTVIKVDPLRIATDDEKLILNENITIIPWHLTDYETKVSIKMDYGWKTKERSGGGGAAAYASHDHDIVIEKKKITIHNALKVGDQLHILSFAHGKQYFILDRV